MKAAQTVELADRIANEPACMPADPNGFVSLHLSLAERTAIVVALRNHGGSAREVTIEECAKCIPTSWLDPLLSGATRIRDLPTLQTEQLLQALAARIRLLAVSRPHQQEDGK